MTVAQRRLLPVFWLVAAIVLWKLLELTTGPALVGRWDSPVSAIAGSALAAAVALLVVGLGLEGASLRELGVAPRRAPHDLAAWCLAGATLFTIATLVLALAGWYRVADVGTSVGTVAAHLGVWFVVAVFEETLFRGIGLRLLDAAVGPWPALAASSLAFGAAHSLDGAFDLRAALVAAGGGILFGSAWLTTRSLWAPVGLHWGWNAAQGALFGFDASGLGLGQGVLHGQVDGPALATGGTAGPEAGLVAACVACAAGALLLGARRGRERGSWHRQRGERSPTAGGWSRGTRRVFVGATTVTLLLFAVVAALLLSRERAATSAPTGEFVRSGTTLGDCAGRSGGALLACRGQALGNIAWKDPAAALQQLDALRSRDESAAAACHWLAHWIGRAAFAGHRGDVAATFAEGSELCASGYYHGAVDRLLVGVPPARADEVMAAACEDPYVRDDQDLGYACTHGIGHALYIQRGRLRAAYDTCARVGPSADADNCRGGAIMEHFAREALRGVRDAAALADACDDLPEAAAAACHRGVGYGLATQLPLQRRLAAPASCLSLDDDTERACLVAAGETLAEETPFDDRVVTDACRRLETGASACITGAGRARALEGRRAEFCARTVPALRSACLTGDGP